MHNVLLQYVKNTEPFRIFGLCWRKTLQTSKLWIGPAKTLLSEIISKDLSKMGLNLLVQQ